jgi:hypothetical protein
MSFSSLHGINLCGWALLKRRSRKIDYPEAMLRGEVGACVLRNPVEEGWVGVCMAQTSERGAAWGGRMQCVGTQSP